MTKKTTIIASCLGIIALTSAIAIKQIYFTNNQKVVGMSSLIAMINKNELIGLSNVAVTGTVNNIKSFATESTALPGEKEVYSDLTFKVDEYIYNPKSINLKEVTIRIAGGEIEKIKMLVEDVPTPEIGHKYVFFLNQGERSDLFLANIGSQGMFEINNDGSLGVGESQKNIIKNIFNKDLTVEELKKELETAKPEKMRGSKN